MIRYRILQRETLSLTAYTYIVLAKRAGGKTSGTRWFAILRISNRYVSHMQTRRILLALPTLVIFVPSVRLSGDEGTNVICPIVLIERVDAAPDVREPNRYVKRG